MPAHRRQKVVIRMKSAQRVGHERDCAETFMRGFVHEKGGSLFIEYTEPDGEAPSGTARTVIELAESGVQIRRTGTAINCYRVSLNRRHLCTYATSAGELMFGFTGREITFERTEKGGRLFLRYELDAGGMLASENEIDLQYKVLENR